jgi:hypothetical protein
LIGVNTRAQTTWSTSPVCSADERTVRTFSGSTYELQGGMNKQMALQYFPAAVLAEFQDGFPRNWHAHLHASLAARRVADRDRPPMRLTTDASNEDNYEVSLKDEVRGVCDAAAVGDDDRAKSHASVTVPSVSPKDETCVFSSTSTPGASVEKVSREVRNLLASQAAVRHKTVPWIPRLDVGKVPSALSSSANGIILNVTPNIWLSGSRANSTMKSVPPATVTERVRRGRKRKEPDDAATAPTR